MNCEQYCYWLKLFHFHNFPLVKWISYFFFLQESQLSFSYAASTDADETLVAGRWASSDSELKPYRTVLVLSADKFDKALEGIHTLLTQ